jgi:hypothetical protein
MIKYTTFFFKVSMVDFRQFSFYYSHSKALVEPDTIPPR